MNKVANGSGFFHKKLPLSVGIIVIILFGVAGIYLSSNKEPKIIQDTTAVAKPPANENIKFRRQKGYELTKPLLITDVPEQSSNMFPVREKIQEYINTHKADGFSDVSVHLLKQNSGEWIGINPEKKYDSKGYLRSAVLITILKMSEFNPGLLNHQVAFNGGNSNYAMLSLTTGKSYSVKKLLEQMMQSSDTTPKFLLIPYVDKTIITNLYEGLGLGRPDFENKKFEITTNGYSKLINVIFNGRYLSEANSEYALKLLSNNTEREGILKLIPQESKVIHKMIQRYTNNQYELRETGIIYCNNETYLLTIFITGKDTKKLEASCGDIGKLVYDEVTVD